MESNALSESQSRMDSALRCFFGEQLLRLIERPDISEISVNPDGAIFISVAGNTRMMPAGHADLHRVEAFICTAATSLGMKLNRTQRPVLEGELPPNSPWNGARILATIPPQSSGPAFTLRAHARKIYRLSDYLQSEIVSKTHYNILVKAVMDRKSILVVGGTESGKTTLLNALVAEYGEISPDLRLVIIEDRSEIQTSLPNTVKWLSRAGSTIPGLVKQAMSNRPDIIIIGEVRDEAAAMFVRAINSGHSGSMCSIHAGSARQGLQVIESYISQGTVRPTRLEIAQAIDYVLYIRKDEENKAKRKIAELVQVEKDIDTKGDYILEVL